MALSVVLAHGASGNTASMRPHVEGLERRGVAARAIELPRRGRAVVPAERAVPVFRAEVGDPAATVVGGHSYGGRVASMLAAEEPRVGGLVLLSYPLHRPGHPDQLRIDHWQRLRCPVLVLGGDRDPFARIDLLRNAVGDLPRAELHVYENAGHGLRGDDLEDALDRIAAFVQGLGARR